MNAKVLVVDDSALARRSMRQHLEALGYTVDEAADGAQALERFSLNPPNLVILDMVMTGMSGLDVLAKLREMDPAVNVFAVTADIQHSTAAQFRASGAKGILNKPVDREKLKSTIATILGGKDTWN